MRSLVIVVLGFAATLTEAPAQQWPARPIEMIIPFSAGGGVDSTGRRIAQAMSEDLKQQIVISNRDGAAGSIGFTALAAAPPDGYVLGGGPTTPISNALHLIKNLRYTVDSFDYVCQTFDNVFALAVPADSKFKTAQELFAAARAQPGRLLFGHAGVSSNSHLSLEALAKSLDLKFQPVVFRGDSPMIPVLLKGDLDFAVPSLIAVRDQNARILLVFADKRLLFLPDVPTAKELGAAPVATVNGIFAPKGLPDEVRKRLETSCRRALQSDEIVRFILNSGQVPSYQDGATFKENTAKDLASKGALLKEIGLVAP